MGIFNVGKKICGGYFAFHPTMLRSLSGPVLLSHCKKTPHSCHAGCLWSYSDSGNTTKFLGLLCPCIPRAVLASVP